jgi:DNA repair protein RecO (recombination protein O)
MPLRDSEAIILQGYPLGEADRLISFLSRSLGRMRGVAPGARRPKSRFGSTLQRLSHVRIWFFERENRELVRISQCELIESFMDAFRDYASGVALSIVTEVAEAVLPEREASDPTFRLVLLVSQSIKRTAKPELPLAYFLLWMVKLGGWLPPLDTCGRCGRAFTTGQGNGAAEPAYFSRAVSALSCAKCRTPGMRLFSAAALAAGRKMLAGRLDQLSDADVPSRAAHEWTQAMLDLIEHQIDRKLKSRELLEAIPEGSR